MPKSEIKLQYTKDKTYIKIVEQYGDSRNLGVITKNSPCWLSLKLKDCTLRYIINEISVNGGDFINHENYSEAEDEKALGLNAGSGFQGGIKFKNPQDAEQYLSSYFTVLWHDENIANSSDNEPQFSENLSKEITNQTSFNKPPINTKPSGEQLNISSNCSWGNLLWMIGTSFARCSLFSNLDAFNKLYSDLVSAFQQCQRFQTIPGNLAHISKAWPDHSGVYAVRKITPDSPNYHNSIVYVGMTGKIKRLGNSINGRLNTRPSRLFPYSFSITGFNFDYNEILKSYSSIIPPDNFEVDCFIFDNTGASAPAFLEAVLLQSYAISRIGMANRLPPANSEF